MKWLIIASEKRETKRTLEFFKVRGWDYEKIALPQKASDGKAQSVFSKICGCTACVFFNDEKTYSSELVSFVLGALAGRGIPFYVQGDKDFLKHFVFFNPELKSYARVFKTSSELLNHMRANEEQIESEERKKACFARLFNAGISFTADSFEFYLEKEKYEICHLILNAGIDVDARTLQGVPLLSVATRSENVEMIEELLSRGADINAVSLDRGYSAVMDAVWRKNYEITKLLLSKGAEVNTMSSDGQSILVLAVGNGNSKIVELLLEYGANPDIKDSMGMSAREYANLFKNETLINLLKNIPKRSEEEEENLSFE